MYIYAMSIDFKDFYNTYGPITTCIILERLLIT
jgi:hypothetical protein